jgi:hypothetical protein
MNPRQMSIRLQRVILNVSLVAILQMKHAAFWNSVAVIEIACVVFGEVLGFQDGHFWEMAMQRF